MAAGTNQNPVSRVEADLRMRCKVSSHEPILLACSGGLDSTALAVMLHEIGQPFRIVHAQFNLRGEDSTADEVFVRELASRLEREFHLVNIDLENTGQPGESIQMAARRTRYAEFEFLRQSTGCHVIATAHHRDDQAETVILRLLRGSASAGLAGMRFRRDNIVRPMLSLGREELRQWASANGMAWREDRSNREPIYLRNRVRMEIMPVLQTIEPAAAQLLSESAELLNEADRLAGLGLSALMKRLLTVDGDGSQRLAIRATLDSGAALSILQALLAPAGFGRKEVRAVHEALLADAQTGRHWESPSHSLYRDRKHLALVPKDEEAQTAPVLISADRQRVSFAGWRYQLRRLDPPVQASSGPDQVVLDASKLDWPLVIRRWREGDYFRPFGLNKKKKIKRFLTDRKVPTQERQEVQVLASGPRIVWVCGFELDHRFRVRASSREILSIRRERTDHKP